MKAMRLSDSTVNRLEECDESIPRPGADEVLIEVHAAGVTRAEVEWHPTTHTKDGGRRSRATPGHEFSAVISSVGAKVNEFRAGQEVYGFNDWFSDGATAEYCLTRPDMIALKPRQATHAEAASVPISALTALQGLFDRAKLSAGDSVLIHGGSGGVGVLAIQLARRVGARVLTTASGEHAAFLSTLGANEVIDYRRERFEERAPQVDVVFDTVGGEILERSWNVLKPGGRLVTIASKQEATATGRNKDAFFIVEPNRRQLEEIARAIDRGELEPVVSRVYPFAEAERAYFDSNRDGKKPGKRVIALRDSK
ncbi:MAG TPA: NADP-dependent oxidoreductase [Chthoniobacteraceae bacterium]|jgi:NADPH:quinone reductase-like Zn-dependent oxidoreductase